MPGARLRCGRAGAAPFLAGLQLIEREAGDGRHFVKKAINMALRAVGKRNRALNTAAVAVATRLAGSSESAPRWVGKDALRELTSASVTQRLAKKNNQNESRCRQRRPTRLVWPTDGMTSPANDG